MMRMITIAVTVVGIAAGATAIAINFDVLAPAAPPPVVVTPPAAKDPASAELLRRMDEDRARAKSAREAGQSAFERRLGEVGKPQKDPTKW